MTERTINRRLDLRGQVCPGPTVDTRLTLKEMAPGEVLEVVTDYYPARQTIPALMRDLGYSCEIVDADQNVFRFIILCLRGVQRRPWGDGKRPEILSATFMDPIKFATLISESQVVSF